MLAGVNSVAYPDPATVHLTGELGFAHLFCGELLHPGYFDNVMFESRFSFARQGSPDPGSARKIGARNGDLAIPFEQSGMIAKKGRRSQRVLTKCLSC